MHKTPIINRLPNIALAGTEVSLVNAMSRETVLKQYLDTVKKDYDFILLDCMPSLGMLTVNALVAADQALIPVQANYLSAKGLEQLRKYFPKSYTPKQMSDTIIKLLERWQKKRQCDHVR